ncbi:MAG: FAD-dependent oxidoreductase [Deltaproteobacteria bacterium]|nr:FAD-dependent oxidoreductase [Deltaproteobacteria bacterium]
MTQAVVVGGGAGGLAAALTLRQAGLEVTLCEASPTLGGLAQAFVDVDSLTRFDGGPYLLLDPVGLTWAFAQLKLSLDPLALRKVDDIYSVERADGPSITIKSSLEETARGLEDIFPGQGDRYRAFVGKTARIHNALAPVQVRSNPGPLSLLRAGALHHAPFLIAPLRKVFAAAGFHPVVQDALGIWTHVAGQRLQDAPSPLGLVPALLHTHGCFVPATGPRGAGVGAVVDVVEDAVRAAGVVVRTSTRVQRITSDHRKVTGVLLASGEELKANVVVSDASGVATLLELADTRERTRRRVAALPLQSPGVAAYVLATRAPSGPYLRFRLRPDDETAPSRLLVRPTLVSSSSSSSSSFATRIVAPLSHAVAQSLGEAGQQALLDRLLDEAFVKHNVGDFVVVRRRVPASWGRAHTLYQDSMNPVMTAKFMRKGRLPHRVPDVDGLFLVGSSTHPGQWVSFCLISGVLGARAALGVLGIKHPEP